MTSNLKQQFFATKVARTHNSGLAKVAVQCSADTFVVNQTLVLHINICGENRHLRQAANRWDVIRYALRQGSFGGTATFIRTVS
jgi:hypothetical protein